MSPQEFSDKIFDLVNSESVNELTELLIADASLTQIQINATNSKKETPLHVGAGKLGTESLLVLLEFGADPNVQDVEGRTPVLTVLTKLRECSCESCRRKAVQCINVLGDFKADMNKEDRHGETPLHLAAEAQWSDCASALLNNGAIIGMFGRKAMLTILLERIPSVISSVFDRSIDVGPNKIHDPDFEVTFDLGVILPTKTMMCWRQSEKQDNTTIVQADKVDPYEEKYVPKLEMGFLLDLVNSAHGAGLSSLHTTILYHPLVHVFVDIKWSRLMMFYCFHLVMQSIFLVNYTLYLFLLTYYDCPYIEMDDDSNGTSITTNLHVGNSTGEILPNIIGKVGDVIYTATGGGGGKCRLSLPTISLAGCVLIFTLYIAASELKQAVMDFKAYIYDILNYCQLMCIGCVLATILVALDSKSRLYFWIYPVAGLGMAMSWLQIFVQVGRLPILAIYVDMFVKVTVRFCCSLAIYSSILISFALSYCILFPLEPKFTDIPLALIRVLTMMVGELDYHGLFSGKNKSPVSSHIWYAAFVILVTLILMNLLVGLAVNDIQRCRKNAEIFVIKRRIRYLWFLEKSFFLGTVFIPSERIRLTLRKAISILVPRSEQNEFVNKRSKSLLNGCYRVRPNDPKDTTLSHETRYCIKQWLEQRSGLESKKNCIRRMLGLQKSLLRKQTPSAPAGPTTTHDGESANVQRSSSSRVYSTPPKLSWSATAADSEEAKALNKVQCNMVRIERKLEELDMKMDAFLKRIDSVRRGEN